MKKIFVLLFVLINLHTYAQNKLELFPGGLNIQPFTANTLEPKLGFISELTNNELHLNIGNSVDILRLKDDNKTYSFGADLFTYTLLRREKNFVFPVDAVDYLFGFNFGYKITAQNYSYGLRFRLSHISAHFVDGNFDRSTQQWRGGLEPFVFSREFVELLSFYSYENLRVYAGGTYLFHVIPSGIGRDNYQIGFDYFLKNIFGDELSPFIGYDFKIVRIGEYSGVNSFSVGMKLGKAGGRGLSLYFNYFSGKDYHGEYYNFNREYSALGFNLDL